MVERVTGGSAFPGISITGSAGEYHQNPYEGMTIRDYFSAHAPFTIEDAKEYAKITNKYNLYHTDFLQILADMRFEYADYMINSRLK